MKKIKLVKNNKQTSTDKIRLFACINKVFGNISSNVRNILKNSKTRNSFFIILVIVMILSRSFAWLYDEFIGTGADITIGEISHKVTQYDSNGEILEANSDTQTIVYESNMSNVTKNSKIIEIKNTGSLDLEFSMTYTLEGTTNVAGILYYRLYEVTDKVESYKNNNSYDSLVKAYAMNNPISNTIENDSDIPISNMTLLNNDITIDQISAGKSKYYRIDYGMYQTVNTSIYSNDSFSVHMNVYSSQVGVISAENTSGQVWNVQNEAQLREVLLSALAGDTIRLIEDININGSLNIPKRINLDTNDYRLTISEDLIYEFVSLGDLKIDTSGTGKLIVGNNFYITAPKANVTIVGDNKKYDVVVGGEMAVSTIQSDGSDGLFLENVRIVKSTSNLIPIDLIVKSNTRVTVGPDVEVGYIYSYEDSTNIEIVNNGYITQIDLSKMKLLDTFTKYQIYVYNLGEIYGALGSTSIVLPSNATPYKKANDGNTLIIKGVTSGDITVSGSDNFNKDDITATEADITVQPVEGEENAYLVYIKDSLASVEGLLTNYFNEHDKNPIEEIKNIKKLIIYTVNAQYVENEDFDFMNSSKIPNLEYLSLANSRVKDNDKSGRIKSRAFYNKTSLKNVLLPSSLTEIGDYAFYNVSLGVLPSDLDETFEFLTIPSTVTDIGAYAFNNSKYIKFKSTIPPTVGSNAFGDNSKLFVINGTIEDYQNTENINEAHVYQTGEISDDHRYIVYETNNGLGLSYIVNNLLTGNTLGVPSVITYQGSNKSVTSLGTNSYREMNITSTTGVGISLPETIDTINSYAFYDLNVTGISLTNVKTIGDYAFYNTKLDKIEALKLTSIGKHAFEFSTLKTVTLRVINEIGESAFASNQSLYQIDLGYVKKINDNAFYDCKKVVRVYISNASDILVNNTQTVDLEVGDNALFSNWGSYVDGRLRFYVTDKTTSSGKTILDLYKEKFSENSNYIYINGNDIENYKYMAVDSELYKYTVRQTTVKDVNGANVSGVEIISYQGPDIDKNYKLPDTLTYNNNTYNVVSIGDSAFINTKVETGVDFRIESKKLLNIANKAFKDFNVKVFIADNLVSIGDNAFENSKLNRFEGLNLKSIGNYAFYNCEDLYVLNLGNISSFGEYSISNIPNLVQLFLNNNSKNISIYNNSLSNIGTNIKDRLRIYVSENESIINYYKELFSAYSSYIYPTGITMGHYYYGSVNYDIGEYTIREVTKTNASGKEVKGWELIEYHGPDLNSNFAIAETVYSDSDDVSVKQTAANCTLNTCNVSFTIYNNSSDEINDWILSLNSKDNLVVSSFEDAVITNNTDGNSIDIESPSSMKTISAGRTINFTLTLIWDSAHDSVDILGINPSMKNNNGRNIISVGDNAFNHTKVKNDSSFNIESSQLLSVGNSAFANLSGIKKVELNNVVSLGNNAFANTSMTSGEFENLNKIGDSTFNNLQYLYKLNLGNVREVGKNALSNIPNLYQVLFSASGTNLSLSIAENSMNDLGGQTNGRMRFYVTNGHTSNNEEYVDIYRSQFPKEFASYFFAYDFVIGSYTPSGITDEIDIGEYSIKETTLTDKDSNEKFGYEYVEYHGEDIDQQFEFPTSLALSDNTMSATWTLANQWGSPGAYTNTIDITVTNNGDTTISSWKVVLDILDGGEITGATNWNNGASFEGSRLTLTNAGFNGILKKGESAKISVQVTHTLYAFTPEIHVIKGNASEADELSVISIGDYAFVHTNVISGSYFDINSDDLIKIGKGVFENNISIRKFIAENCISVGDYAFNSAYGLIYASFPNLQSLGSYVFYNDNNLISADIGKSNAIKEGAFYGTSKLLQLFMSNKNVAVSTNAIGITIAENAFTNMGTAAGNRLRIYVPDGETASGLTYLDAYKNGMPSNLKNYIFETGIVIGDYVATNTDINVGQYTIKKVMLDNVTGWQIIEYHGNNIDDSFDIPETITVGEDTRTVLSVGPYAYYFADISEDYIWDLEFTSIKYIYDYAFYQRSVNSVTGDKIKYVGSYAFAQSSKLISVTLENVENISEYAFYRCPSLYMVHLGSNVVEIKDFAFYNSWVENSLNQFYINTKNPPIIYQNTLPAQYWNSSSLTIYVPYNSTSLYSTADYWKDYTSVSIGSIYNSEYIYEIINGNQIKITNYIGNSSSLIIPDTFTIDNVNYNVVAISNTAFDGASRLNSIVLGAYVNNVGNSFLENNNTVKNIYVNTNNQFFSSDDGVLYDRNGETLIRYPRAKKNWSYTVGYNTKVISNGAFANCINLTTITFDTNLIALSDNAFNNSSSLKELYFNSSVPPYFTGFEPFPMNSGLNIYYPRGAENVYKQNVYFNWYSNYLKS